MFVRTVLGLEGKVEVGLICEPAFDYGRVSAQWTAVDGDRHVADATGAGQTIRLRSDLALGIEGNSVRAHHILGPGDRVYCALSWDEGLPAPRDADEAEGVNRSHNSLLAYLARRSARSGPPLPHADRTLGAHHQRSHVYADGRGGRSSHHLSPGDPRRERNWDYRYTWMRDATFMLQALHWLKLDWEADEFMQFVADVEATEDGSLQIMYGIDGRRQLPGSTRDDLSGYAGARPVRVGNAAFSQRQNDVFGAVSTRSFCTRGTTRACRAGSGRSSRRRRSAPPVFGATPIKAFGRLAVSHSITCRPN